MQQNQPRIIWESKPSQLLNLNIYIVNALVVILLFIFQGSIAGLLSNISAIAPYAYLLPAFLVVAVLVNTALNWLKIDNQRYILTDEVFRHESGILTRYIEELELYRVKYTTTIEPFQLRTFGYGDIRIDTTDSMTPVIYIEGIKEPEKLREVIRNQVENMRGSKGIVEVGNINN